MFGAPSMHEQLRYGQPSEEYPYSDTDKAYEKIKSQICRVGKRKPCGSAISRLERDTVFIRQQRPLVRYPAARRSGDGGGDQNALSGLAPADPPGGIF